MTSRLAIKWKERAKEDRVNREQIKMNQIKILEDMTIEELVFKKLHDELGWNLTSVGEKLVRDAMTVLNEINNSDPPLKIEREDDLPKETGEYQGLRVGGDEITAIPEEEKHKTMFAEIVAIHNNSVGKTIHTDVFLSVLFEKGFITKNRDGSYYVSSFRDYKAKLKKGGFVKYDPNSEFIEIIKRIPPKTKPKDL